MTPSAKSPAGDTPSPGPPFARPACGPKPFGGRRPGAAPEASDTQANGTKEPPAKEAAEGARALSRWGPWFWTGWVILVALLATADQVTKAVAQARLEGPLARTVVFIPRILSFTYRQNPGGPFSLLAQSRWAWALGPLALAATAAVVWWLARSQVRSWLEGIGCALIVGGAVGNLIDRLLLGAVRDFLKLTCIRWPVFNLADAFVSVGVGLLLLAMLRGGVSPAESKR